MKKLEAIACYLAFEGNLDLLSDVESLKIFFHSHDFDTWTNEEISAVVTNLKLSRSKFLQAKKTLSSAEIKLLQSYIALCDEVESLPNFTETQIPFGVDEIQPYAHLQKDVAQLSQEKARLNEKEDQLLTLQEALEAKEQLLSNQAHSMNDSRISSMIRRIDERVHHFSLLVKQHQELSEAQYKKTHSLVERESQLKLSIADLTNTNITLQSEIVRSQNSISDLENKKIILDADVRDKNKELIRLSKQMNHISQKYRDELDVMEKTRKEIVGKELELEKAFERVDAFKQELFEKQAKLEEQDANMAAGLREREKELESQYLKKFSQLQKEYESRQKELFRKIKRASVKKTIEKHSQEIHDVELLLDVARNEATFNPFLAKNTYARLVQLYNTLSKQEQKRFHQRIVDLHNFIRSKQ